MAKFEIYQDKGNEWRWRLKADNHEVIADSNEGYKEKRSAENGIELVKRLASDANVVEV